MDISDEGDGSEMIAVCNDCGAQAPTEAQVVHYPTCEPGESAKWEAFYDNAPSQEEDEKADREYEE